jgi:hypothetical protein
MPRMLSNLGYRHALRLSNPYRFSTVTVVTRTRLHVTLYVRWVHTCNVTPCRKAVTLQVLDTIRSYELNFHPVPHGVTVSCERCTVGFPVCYGSPSDVSAASSNFVHLYIQNAALNFTHSESRITHLLYTAINTTKHGQVSQCLGFTKSLTSSIRLGDVLHDNRGIAAISQVHLP